MAHGKTKTSILALGAASAAGIFLAAAVPGGSLAGVLAASKGSLIECETASEATISARVMDDSRLFGRNDTLISVHKSYGLTSAKWFRTSATTEAGKRDVVLALCQRSGAKTARVTDGASGPVRTYSFG